MSHHHHCHGHSHGHHVKAPAIPLPRAALVSPNFPMTPSTIQGLKKLQEKGVLLYVLGAMETPVESLKWDVVMSHGDSLSYESSTAVSYGAVLKSPKVMARYRLEEYEGKKLIDVRKKNQYLFLGFLEDDAREIESQEYKVLSYTDSQKPSFPELFALLLQRLEVIDTPANAWTKFGALMGFLVDFMSNTTLFAAFMIYASSNDEDPDELGYTLSHFKWALIYGFLVGLSTTYCHFVLETQGQQEKAVPWGEGFLDFKDPCPDLRTEIPRFDNEDSLRIAQRQSLRLSSCHAHAQQKNLRWYQNLALFGDALGHMGDLASPLIAVVRIAGSANLSKTYQWIVNGGILLLSFVGAGADFRTCFMSLVQKKETHEHTHADWITLFGSFMTAVVELVNGATVCADIFPDFFPQRNDFLGYSREALLIGLLPGILMAMGGTYADYLEHKYTQDGQGLMNTRNDTRHIKLPVWKQIMLYFDFGCLTAGFASPLILAWNIAGLDTLGKAPRLAVTGATLVISGLGIVPGYRNHEKAVRTSEKDRQSRSTGGTGDSTILETLL
jgi:hypothetical protein